MPQMMAQTLQLSVGNGAPPPLPPTASFSPSVSLPGRPQASRCAQPHGWFWLPPSLSPFLQHCILHRGKDHLSRSLQPSACTREPGEAALSQAQRSSLALFLLPSLRVSDLLLPQGIPSLSLTAQQPVTGASVASFLRTAPHRPLAGSLALSPS